MKFSLFENEAGANLTVFVNGEMYTATDQHPNWDAIREALRNEDESVADLFDVSVAVAKQFDRLSDRVTVAYGTLYFDGEPLVNALTKQIVRFMTEKVRDYKPLVNFMEKVYTNPNEHSRDQLFEWLNRHDFTITEDGDFLAYKGVRDDLTSVRSGPAIVDGKAVDGHVPNQPGSLVEMARGQVQHNPGIGCAEGLHAGTWSYASGFGPKVVRVKINPRDVVSVPTDCNAQKIRACRYTVLNVADAPNETAVAKDVPHTNHVHVSNVGNVQDRTETVFNALTGRPQTVKRGPGGRFVKKS